MWLCVRPLAFCLSLAWRGAAAVLVARGQRGAGPAWRGDSGASGDGDAARQPRAAAAPQVSVLLLGGEPGGGLGDDKTKEPWFLKNVCVVLKEFI